MGLFSTVPGCNWLFLKRKGFLHFVLSRLLNAVATLIYMGFPAPEWDLLVGWMGISVNRHLLYRLQAPLLMRNLQSNLVLISSEAIPIQCMGKGMENQASHNLNSQGTSPTLGQTHNSSLAAPPPYYQMNMTLVTLVSNFIALKHSPYCLMCHCIIQGHC